MLKQLVVILALLMTGGRVLAQQEKLEGANLTSKQLHALSRVLLRCVATRSVAQREMPYITCQQVT